MRRVLNRFELILECVGFAMETTGTGLRQESGCSLSLKRGYGFGDMVVISNEINDILKQY
jgi:hypothetical protein